MKRFGVLVALLATYCCIVLVTVHATETQTAGVGAAMTTAAQAFLTSLDADQTKKAAMKFDDPARLDWHNIPKPERKGLQIRDMNSQQRTLCHNLLPRRPQHGRI